MSLASLGWPTGVDPGFVGPDERPGRIAMVHGAHADVLWVPGDIGAVRSGTFPLRRDLELPPVAGDWVALDTDGPVRVAPRTTALQRPEPGGKGMQVLAANIDVVLVVVPIDRGINTRALERLGVLAWDSGAEPVVVLTKADAATDPAAAAAEAELVLPGVTVVVTSACDGTGLTALRDRMRTGSTSAMLGASGAGKTSLLNALEGRDEAVRPVRRDGAGRHTTSTRRLYRLRSGGVLLDLPGIRSLALHATDAAVDDTFAEIAELARGCRFRDCTHAGDPGCAVAAAVADGALPARRLDGWRAVRREMAFLARRDDPAAMAAQRAEWKRITKASRRDR
ncbi:MAG: ribosome small subunit-dependent GTPase A [Pseudonocardia sp.]